MTHILWPSSIALIVTRLSGYSDADRRKGVNVGLVIPVARQQ